MRAIRFSIYFLSFLSILWIMHSCAVEASPLGGPLDKIPPFPDSTESSPNYQLFFEKQEIFLSFNEWVKLKNQNQIIVSPPLEFPLDIKLKGKKLIMAFDEEEQLYSNTTYTINLGQSITDYTQGNPMGNYTYVFSTGSFIDSLSISGKVVDDFTGEPMEEILVGLYAEIQDSAIYKSRPLYFARTNKEGRYQINNIRTDTFLLFALDDKNLNYFKDQESEGMGFLKEPIYLDTLKSKYDLGFYVPDPSLRIGNKVNNYGQVRLSFNRDAFDLNYRFDPELAEHKYYQKKDSAWFWFDNNEERNLIIEKASEKFDTIPLIVFNDSLKLKRKVKIISMNTGKKVQLAPSDSLEISFNCPVTNINPAEFQLIDTSGTAVKYKYKISQTDPRKVSIKPSWIQGQKYDLHINPGAIENSFNYTIDTTKRIFVVALAKSLGEIMFELDSLNEDFQYIVELTLAKNTYTKLVSNVESTKFSLKGLKPGQYKVRVFEDVNKNGRWDPGNFLERKFSEQWIIKNLESLKANWTLEVSINGIEFK